MERGKIKINQAGKAKKFSKSDGKGATVPSTFDFSQFSPGTHECEYEIDEHNRVTKIIINGQIVPFNKQKLKEKEELQKEREQKKQAEEKHKKELEENKKIIEEMKNDFAKVEKAFLPSDTFDALKGNEWKIDNFALRLNKLARFEENEKDFSKSKFQFYKTDRNKIIYEPKVKFDKNFIKWIENKNFEIESKIIDEDNLYSQKFNVNWRMIVGLGHESVYETSITLHHVYGIPYIPASAIKGVVRSYIIQQVFGNPESGYVPEEEMEYSLINAEMRALTQSKTFCKIFGNPSSVKKVKFSNKKPVKKNKDDYVYESPENTPKVAMRDSEGNPTASEGNIIFFDAFPIEAPSIEPDVMNVHYPDYYSKDNIPPTDYQNPNPIYFLTVKGKFKFVIAARNGKLEDYKIADKTITEWLKEALETHGIGAKTAVGYGRMKQN